MVRFTSLLLAIGAARDGIVLIDEIENGLHYSVQSDAWRVMLDAAERYNVQVFATTHSREMVTSAHEAFQGRDDYDDVFRLHRLQRSAQSGEIEAVTYRRDTLDAAIDMNLEVR